MAQQQSSNDPLENIVQATAEVAKRAEERVTEGLEMASEHVREGASNASASFNEARSNMADKALEKTAEKAPEKEVVVAHLAEKSQAGTIAAYQGVQLAHEANREAFFQNQNMSPEQRVIAEERIQYYIAERAKTQTVDVKLSDIPLNDNAKLVVAEAQRNQEQQIKRNAELSQG